MRLGPLLLLAVAAPAAFAHFPYIVPEGPGKARVVFSDTLKADDKVPADRMANLKLQALTDGKADDVALTLDKKANVYRFDVPAAARVVAGTLNYGVLQRGDAKPFLLKYHPKAVVGPWANGAVSAGKAVPLEVAPETDGGKVRFVVTLAGQPLAKAEVSVLVPGDDKPKAVLTDDAGRTELFDKSGQYAVQAKHAEAASGDVDGKKYAEVRHYATLVVTVGK